MMNRNSQIVDSEFQFLGKLDISRKYGIFAYFCMIVLFIMLIPSRYGFVQFYSIKEFLYRLMIASLISGLFTFFEKIRIREEPSTNMYFLNMTFKQQLQQAKIISKHNNLGLMEEKNKLSIYNKQIIVEYTPDECYQFQCSELNSNPRMFKVIAIHSFEHLDTGLIKFLNKFTTKTTYNDSIQIFKEIFENRNIYECIPKEYAINSGKKEINILNPVIEFNLGKIDINNASEEELASLAGLNIVSAKKAIQYRDLKGGFKTFDEFVKVVNLKTKFIPQVRIRIEIGEYNDKKIENQHHSDRIVDF